MKTSLTAFDKNYDEGYVYSSYGSELHLKHVVSSVVTLRRYDQKRPVLLYCSEEHKNLLTEHDLSRLFLKIEILPEKHRSILGFKHNIQNFMPFRRNLILDSDIIWCRNPDPLWQALKPYKFTITGNQIADIFFGGPKGFSVLIDVLLRRRRKTLKHFGLSYLSRVQAGMIYTSDKNLADRVSRLSDEFYSRKKETHFISRKNEKGRSDESCEWSLAMAMSALRLQVFPWLNGFECPQLDYIKEYTEHNSDFTSVSCLYYSNKFVYDMKSLKNRNIRKLFIKILSLFPGKGDKMYVTPYCLHFGWMDQKNILNDYSEKCWNKLISE